MPNFFLLCLTLDECEVGEQIVMYRILYLLVIFVVASCCLLVCIGKMRI